jgi:hypothetical protein
MVGALLCVAASQGVLAADTAKAGVADVLIREVTDTLMPSGVYNVVTYAAPRAVKVADLGLREAGVAAGPMFQKADELRIFASRAALDASPQARLWFNAREGGQLWYHTGGAGSAAGHVLQPGEVLVIHTRVSTQPIAWVNVLR